MTTWTSESDVLLDLDTLSGFSNVSRVSHPTSKAFGGSRSLPSVNQMETNDYSDPVMFDSNSERIPTGRGQMIQQLSELRCRNRSGELHSQLRKACGRGYSNELIEAEFGFYSKFDCSSTGQSKISGDTAERSISPVSTDSPILDNTILEEQPSTTSDSSKVQPRSTKPNKLFACPRQGLKKRNALLNSLYNLHHIPTISSDAIGLQAEDNPSIDKECNTQTCSNTSTTSPSCPQKSDMFLPHSSECSVTNSGKAENAIIHGNHYGNILSNDTGSPIIKQNITMTDYFPSDSLSSSDCSQFIGDAYRNSTVLLGSRSDQINVFNLTNEDFPPL